MSGRGADAYRANTAAMSTAADAAAALFEAADDTARHSGCTGKPLHALRQHLDQQIHRLHTDAAHLAERAAAAPLADTDTDTDAGTERTTDETTAQPVGEEQPAPEEQPTDRTQEGGSVASQTAGELEVLTLFGDLPSDAPGEQAGSAASTGAMWAPRSRNR